VKNTLREVASRNVVAKLKGSDRKFRHELVIYSAHWDHLGRDPKLSGDPIYHGAYDNATGVAGLLEIAREFVATKPRPKRSLLFLAPTAEEQGLLGAKYYAEQPLYPLNRTLADLNMDGLNPWGRTRDVSVIGFGSTTLEDLLKSAADGQGRVLIPDAEPEKGGFFRADHFELVKVGVPSLYFDSGQDYLGKPAGYGKKKSDEFTQNDYHKVTDVIKPDWDLSGAIEDLQLLLAVGRAVANGDRWPEWKDGSEFQKRRAAMLRPRP
jgi:Zn-dependent M28 family amino/carboxypeptidase